MASPMARLTLAVIATFICKSATVCANYRIVDTELADSISLLQTDLIVEARPAFPLSGRNNSASSRKAAAGQADVSTSIWQWVAGPAQLEGSVKDATEAAKRFHKDFIAAALIMTCVLPLACHPQNAVASTQREGRSRLWRMLPSGQSLRILLVLLLWLKHYCFKGHHSSLEILFVLAGAVFDFVNQHDENEDDMWKKLSEFVPEQFARLYPFYTFYVVVYYLAFFSLPSATTETFFAGSVLLSRACGMAAWCLSVVFGCYLVLPVLASPPEHIQSSAVAMISAGCVAMLVLPRTLAAPVHSTSPWTWSEEVSPTMHLNPDGAMIELFFARRSLLLGLAHFFFGLVLARARLFLFSAAECSDVCKESPCEVSDAAAGQENQRSGQREVDLWKEFEDEAKRDMVRSLSINKSADHMNHGYPMSPRSDHSD